MERFNLKSAWKKLQASENSLDKEQINQIIMEKYQKILRQRIDYLGMSILLSVSVLAYVIFTALLRWSDPYFVALNGVLACYLVVISIISIKYFRRLTSPDTLTEGVKQALEKRARAIEQGFKRSRWDLALIYPFGILLILSIHVFFERLPLPEVLRQEESIWGLSLGIIIGMAAATVYYHRITKHFSRQMRSFLDQLEEVR